MRRVTKCICLYLPQKWNTEAEANAQKWANTCSMTHSPATSGCGENLHMSSFKNSWTNVLQAWYNKVKDLNRLVVWYNSNQIGCAMPYCPNSTYKYFYLPRPYKSGPSCADCPSACENKLCCKSRTQECTIKNGLQQSAAVTRACCFCVAPFV
uniref:SCP domain-containing protein n=1 Tax=Oryzias latipes TaxID=8090 RepID=A0A3P9J6Z0_ORYLA